MGRSSHAFLAALELMRLPGVGAASFRRLLDHDLCPRLALQAARSGLRAAGTAGVRRGSGKGGATDLFERTVSHLASPEGARTWVTWYGHRHFPARLNALSEPSPILFVRGRRTLLASKRAVGIIGTRRPTPAGCLLTERLARSLSGAGVVVVSGGAMGIDTVAHRAALTGGMNTVAVLGTGIDVAYPRANAGLLATLARHGALVTEFVPGTPPVASHFPTRNRIVAGLCDALVLIEGMAGSGALTTVRWMVRLGRPVIVLRAPGLLTGAAAQCRAAGWPVRWASSVQEIQQLILELGSMPH